MLHRYDTRVGNGWFTLSTQRSCTTSGLRIPMTRPTTLPTTVGAAALDDVWGTCRDTIDAARVKAAPKKQLTHQYYKALPVGRPGELGNP